MKIILIALLLTTYTDLLAQQKPYCSSKSVQDSLFQHYSRRAHEFGLEDMRWVQTFDTLIAICPNISEAYQERALAYVLSGNVVKVFENIDKAVELEPRRWLPYRGYLHCIFAKQYEKGIADFEAAEMMMPNAFTMDHSFSFFMAMAHTGLKNYEKAESYFLKDIATQKRGEGQNDIHYNTLLYFGIMHYLNNDLDKAEIRLRECLQLYEQHPTANYYMALILKATGDKQNQVYFEKAKQYLNDGYKINEPNSYLVPYPLQVTPADLDTEEKN
ncbi:tetratricopeptide repeat protein [Dyadobacter arcticus]|uniref:Tetratricopeptide (TPR) repeat protein n=1 Tax=Dyadobacter arcticus TaxID=1078754 RepID=A0ABX0UVS3_9BACT|nr:tetratricopeptide repeat protein [Dyadobacter arcticus]NIJ55041.1 tetratricopeptide (TPR) repeat protein [Dyadobacter arcticus]